MATSLLLRLKYSQRSHFHVLEVKFVKYFENVILSVRLCVSQAQEELVVPRKTLRWWKWGATPLFFFFLTFSPSPSLHPLIEMNIRDYWLPKHSYLIMYFILVQVCPIEQTIYWLHRAAAAARCINLLRMVWWVPELKGANVHCSSWFRGWIRCSSAAIWSIVMVKKN